MIVIKISTGFVGEGHEYETGLSQQEWDDMPEKEQNEIVEMAVWEKIDAYPVDDGK